MSLYVPELVPRGEQLIEQPPESQADWYVAYTQPKREQLAVDNLLRQGFEAYLPQYKIFKKTAEGMASYAEPMFARYVFFRPVDAGLSISSVRSTRGVSFVLSFGFQTAVVKDVQMKVIKACEQARSRAGIAQISPFQPGVKVRMHDSNLQGLEGLVTSVSSKRVMVLLELLGKSHEVSVDHHRLALAG